MSQELPNSLNSTSNDVSDIFVGTPSLEEMKKYMMRQKRIVDLKGLEASPDLESTPELSESFEMYLQQRKLKAEQERRRLMNDTVGFVESPRTGKAEPLRKVILDETIAFNADNTMNQCNDDSFLLMEKLCENTLHLQNVSENLVDLTGLDSSDSDSKKSFNLTCREETHLFSIEAPSFLFNNTSLQSPKNSPLRAVHANRPSTILEVSEACSSNRTCQSSYRTALTRSADSEDYKTANEDTLGRSNQSIEDELVIKMPKLRSFYGDLEMTKDSLEPTAVKLEASGISKDSLDIDTINIDDSSVNNSSSGVDSSYDQRNDNDQSEQGEERMNDTLEQIEFMLAQAQKIQDQKANAATSGVTLKPPTPRVHPASPLTPFNLRSAGKPKGLYKPVSASKLSPLIKFSPAAKNSPIQASGSAFKKPAQSASKLPPPSISASKKFQHIESPISRYIKQTPGLPLQSTAKTLPGMGGSPRQFNFRDSESFANENESLNTTYKGSSLPMRAKTKSSAVSHVFDQREIKKTPGGAKIQSLIGNSPTVTVHQGHVKTHDRPMTFHNAGKFNETAISEQSFADLSLISGDVSVQVIEGAKRTKN